MVCKINLSEVLAELNDWKTTNDDREAVEKEFKFKDFKSAYSFMTSIALKAEEVGHHPEWFNVYKKVKITLTTHDVNVLIEKDIILGKFIDNQYEK